MPRSKEQSLLKSAEPAKPHRKFEYLLIDQIIAVTIFCDTIEFTPDFVVFRYGARKTVIKAIKNSAIFSIQELAFTTDDRAKYYKKES